VDFLHHGIHLDVEVGDDGVDVRQRSGRGLRGRERCGSGDQLLGGGLLLIKELTGGQDTMTRDSGLLLGSFDSNDLGVKPLLEDLGVGGGRATMFDGMMTKGEEGGVNSKWVVAP
jgi:hypothetical protein